MAMATTAHSSSVLVPPREFGTVASQVHISAFPHVRSLPFLEQLGVASVVFMTPKHPLKYDLPDEMRTFLASRRYQWLPVEKAKDKRKIMASHGTIKAGIESVLRAPKPVLLSGFDSVEAVVLLVACLRKLQCWDMSSIQQELERSMQVDLDALHVRFITQFCTLTPAPLPRQHRPSFSSQPATSSTDASSQILVLPRPSRVPDWLWYGYRSPSALLFGSEYVRDDLSMREMTWHPTMRIAYSSHGTEPHDTDEHGALDNGDGMLDCDEDIDLLPTPRCTSSAGSPTRGDSYLTVHAQSQQNGQT